MEGKDRPGEDNPAGRLEQQILDSLDYFRSAGSRDVKPEEFSYYLHRRTPFPGEKYIMLFLSYEGRSLGYTYKIEDEALLRDTLRIKGILPPKDALVQENGSD